jgi:hypothetical protein
MLPTRQFSDTRGADEWLARLPLISRLPRAEAAARLREIGEDDLAGELSADPRTAPAVMGTWPVPGRDRAWLHTTHTIGYLGPVDAVSPSRHGLLPVHHAVSINADDSLVGARIKITLDALRAADYPGRGIHRIWLAFAARNQTSQGPEQLHFNATCRVADGEQVAVLGRPIFTGLRIGTEGIFLQLATVNVTNEGDETLLRFLDGDAFKGGLKLLTTAQPAIAPLSALAVGLTEAIANRSRNITVQAVDLGLDFSKITSRPRLAEGTYFAVQIPEDPHAAWHWDDWGYDMANGRLVNTAQADLSIPHNYVAVSVSRYHEYSG